MLNKKKMKNVYRYVKVTDFCLKLDIMELLYIPCSIS